MKRLLADGDRLPGREERHLMLCPLFPPRPAAKVTPFDSGPRKRILARYANLESV
jgi:hypothetical protein